MRHLVLDHSAGEFVELLGYLLAVLIVIFHCH